MSEAAKVAIVNQALFLMGQEPVADLSDESIAYSNAAFKVLRVMDDVRRQALRRHGWLCALEYVTLFPAADAARYASWRYPVTFLLPGDCQRVWTINGTVVSGRDYDDGSVRWQVGTTEVNGAVQHIIRACANAAWGQAITSDDPPASGAQPDKVNASYVRLCDWEAMDAHLADYVAHELAARSAHSITGDKDLAKDLRVSAADKGATAVSSDSGQEGNQPELAPSIPQAIRNRSR